MNYYYDLVLNFSEDNLMFYEWNKNDTLEIYKRIPFFQVTGKAMKDLINYNICVPKDFLELIHNKAKGGESMYVALFADKNGAIALEFNEDGKSIYRSFLSLEDELNILELLYTTNVSDIKYKKLTGIPYKKTLREYDNIKKIILTEIRSLLKNKDYDKLKYLYMEWFNKDSNDIDEMVQEMEDVINKNISAKEIRIYELIKLSYNLT